MKDVSFVSRNFKNAALWWVLKASCLLAFECGGQWFLLWPYHFDE